MKKQIKESKQKAANRIRIESLPIQYASEELSLGNINIKAIELAIEQCDKIKELLIEQMVCEIVLSKDIK